MKVFRKVSLLFLVAVFVFGLGIEVFKKSQPQIREYISTEKPCRTPLKYSLGNIDPQFGISSDKLKEAITQAAGEWEKSAGLNLFEYDPQATLKISLVYDKRQQATNEAGALEAGLKVLESQRDAIDKQQNALSNEYNKKLAVFKAALSSYQDSLQKYNKEVSYWNERGGAPDAEYKKLKKEEDDLSGKLDSLQAKESELNDLAKKSNALLNKENKIISSYNNAARTYKSEFGNSQEFEKGIFDPSAGITIYQFKEVADLELTLEHELGHALGIGHVENPQSIMYYMIGEQNLDNPTFTNEDLAALKETCQLE